LQRQEPEFLDLNAAHPGRKSQFISTMGPTTDSLHADKTKGPSGLSETRPLGSTSQTLMSEQDHDGELIKSDRPELNGSAVIQAGVQYEADAGDDLLPRVSAQEAQPPKITYHHGKQCPDTGFIDAYSI
jgi:hypothetical protein